jgi:hypothetical protein
MMAADDATAGSMFTPPMGSAQSTFTDFPAELYKWGYVVDEEKGWCEMGNIQYGMEDAFTGLGVSSDYRRWKCYTAHHGKATAQQVINDQRYVVDGRTYRVSDQRENCWTGKH